MVVISGDLVIENFASVSSTATLGILDDNANVQKQVALRTSQHGLARVTRRASVFDDLALVEGLIAKVGGALPADFDWMLRALAPAQARIESAVFDAVPCHGDGNVSKVLMHDDGSMRLVDWDVAALRDTGHQRFVVGDPTLRLGCA